MWLGFLPKFLFSYFYSCRTPEMMCIRRAFEEALQDICQMP